MNYTKEQLLEAAEIVDRAHDVILERGWVSSPGSVYMGKGECMESSVNAALSITTPYSVLRAPELDAMGKWWLYVLLKDSGITWDFNDAEGRTEDEVFDRMRDVAKQFRDEAGAL